MKDKCLLVMDSSPFGREVMKKVFGTVYKIRVSGGPLDLVDTDMVPEPDVLLYQMRVPSVRQLEMLFTYLNRAGWDSPVVVISSSGSLPLERYARTQGVFFWMTNPYNLQELWDVVEAAFGAAKSAVG